MARHYGPIAVPKSIVPWLYNALNRLNESSEQSSAGLSAIVRGEAPDGSGNPLVPDLSDYFYKPGIIGGQTAHGGTENSSRLILSSTKSSTKGPIYLGTELLSAYNEANHRLGIRTIAPQASGHFVGVAGGVAYSASTFSNSGWGLYSGSGGGGAPPATVHAAITSPYDGDGGYIGRNGDNNGISANCIVVLNTSVGSGTTFTVRFWARILGAAIPSGTSFLIGVRNSAGNEYTSSGAIDPTTFTSSWVEYTVTCGTAAAGATADSVRVSTVFQSGTSTSGYILVSYVEVLIGAGTSTGSLIAQAASGQTSHIFDAQNSSATSLIDITSGGRLTIESGGTMRIVPNAGANRLWTSDASGDMTLVAVSGDLSLASGVWTIVADAVTFAKMQNVTGPVLIGRVTASAGDMSALTPTQATALLDVFTTALKGLVPSGGSATTFLRGDATWQLLTDSGWTDDGATVRLTTSTNQVGIGTVTPSASLAVVNVNATTDIVFKVVGKLAQTGSLVSVQNSTARNLFSVGSTGSIQIGNGTDTGNTIVNIGADAVGGPTISSIMWKDNFAALGAPVLTADYVGCVGARLYAYKDVTGQYDAAYGQGADAWVLISDEAIEYNFYTGVLPAGTASFLRCTWAGNGDYTNYGFIHARKSLSAVTKGVPGIRLEETGTGIHYIAVQAPAVVTANRTQLLLNMTGTHPLVGDDPPAVAAGAMGKVDSTGLGATGLGVPLTNLTSGALAGMYLVDYTLIVTTADVTAGTINFQASYTDTLAATNQADALPLALNATGRQRGQFVVQLASAELSYQTNLTGILATARYALYVRVIYLG